MDMQKDKEEWCNMDEEILNAMEECKAMIHDMRTLRLNGQIEECQRMEDEIEEKIVRIADSLSFLSETDKTPGLHEVFLMDKYFSLVTFFDVCKEL